MGQTENRTCAGCNLTWEDWETISGYRDAVFLLQSVNCDIAFRLRRGLPLMDLMEQAHRLKVDIIRFENVLQRIQDRRTRNVLRCRFVLGYSIPDTAEYLGTTCTTIDNIIKKVKPPRGRLVAFPRGSGSRAGIPSC